MRQELKIGKHKIGPGYPIFITAEIGVTCNHDLNIAKELIDVTSEAGADAVKFLLVFPDEFMSNKDVTFTYETTRGVESVNMYEMFLQEKFTFDEWRELKQYSDQKNVEMFASVSTPSGIEYTEKLGLPAYKFSSWDFNYHPLWRKIARKNKPVIIDTGPVRMLDLAKVVNLLQEEGNDQALLVHCVHTDNPEEINMRTIQYLRRAFNSLVGYTSRGRNNITDIMAVSMETVYMEKRLTLDRDLPGHHHILALEPDEFREYVRIIRDAQASLGIYDLIPSRADVEERPKWFRHVVANRAIPAGTILTEDLLEGKRPEAGISPEHMDLLVGRTVKRDLKENEAVLWEDV